MIDLGWGHALFNMESSSFVGLSLAYSFQFTSSLSSMSYYWTLYYLSKNVLLKKWFTYVINKTLSVCVINSLLFLLMLLLRCRWGPTSTSDMTKVVLIRLGQFSPLELAFIVKSSPNSYMVFELYWASCICSWSSCPILGVRGVLRSLLLGHLRFSTLQMNYINSITIGFQGWSVLFNQCWMTLRYIFYNIM